MMLKSLFCNLLLLSFATLSADEVIWKGNVKASGSPTEAIKLINHETYKIKVSKFVNLGKWVQAGEKLASDACYEFSQTSEQSKLESLKNSLNISVCDGKYHPDHTYESEFFEAKQNRIHFWINDTDYNDNSGELYVEIIHKAK